MNIQEILTIIGSVLGIIGAITGSSLYVKYSKYCKNKRLQKKKRNETIDRLPEMLSHINDKLDDLTNNQETTREDLSDLRQKQNQFEDRFDLFENSQLKYIINDSFFSYENIHEMPDEQLYMVAECCDIYIAKGLNHTTGSRCKIISEEIEKRQRERAEGHNE